MKKLLTMLVLLALVASMANADFIENHLDAAKYDQYGYGMDWERAIVCCDARRKSVSDFEVSFTSIAWGDIYGLSNMSTLTTPWESKYSKPDLTILDGAFAGLPGESVKVTMGTIVYTPGSRVHPSVSPITFWETVAVDKDGFPVASGSIDRFVPAGLSWAVIPVASTSFFASPATATAGGESLSDPDEMPNFEGLQPIPEPLTIAIIACGLPLFLRRR